VGAYLQALMEWIVYIMLPVSRRVYQADFVGAYLQALMEWIVYIMLPVKLAEYFPDLAEWFGVPLLLYKSAYGMNSAGCLWAEDLFEWYSNYSFLQSSVELALFTYIRKVTIGLFY
jgi:hypothetical protein